MRRSVACVLLLIWFFSATMLGAPSPITINAAPRVLNLNQQVRITIRVEPDERNRTLLLEWWVVEGLENRKFEQVDGADSKRIFQYYLTLREGGMTTFKATILRNDQSSQVALTDAQVIGVF